MSRLTMSARRWGMMCVCAILLSGVGACKDPVNPLERVTLDLRTEAGALNYAYALTQLEQDFYYRVAYMVQFPGMRTDEWNSFAAFQVETGVAAEEFIATHHAGRITDFILFRISEHVDWSDRSSVMTTAQTLADAAAQGLMVAKGYATSTEGVARVDALADAAGIRANTIRGFNGAGPLVMGTPSPVALMEQLQPYYRTTIVVVVP